MSIVKFANGRCSRLRQLKQVLAYIQDPKKTTAALTCGFGGVDERNAFEDMRSVKAWYKKMTGRQYIHFILSFDALKEVTPELAYKVGVEVGSYYSKRYQVLMTTHFNTDNYHCHYVCNTIQMDTGLKFTQSKSDLVHFKEFTNSILEKFGLPAVKRGKELEGTSITAGHHTLNGCAWDNTVSPIRETNMMPVEGTSCYWALERFNEDEGCFLEVPVLRPQDMNSEFIVSLKSAKNKSSLIKPIIKLG